MRTRKGETIEAPAEYTWLQWGRVRENAESMLHRSPEALISPTRFNGAAFVRTRKDPLARDYLSEITG